MPRVVQIPDIRKVDLPETRQAIPYLHAYLRNASWTGRCSPVPSCPGEPGGSARHQPHPLREVLRCCRKRPGRDRAEPADPGRLDPAELDDVYASRILLETLALSMTSVISEPRRAPRPADADRDAAAAKSETSTPGSPRTPTTTDLQRGRGERCSGSCAPSPTGPPATSHLPAVRAEQLAGRRRRGARRDPGSADRGRRTWPLTEMHTTWPARRCGCSPTARRTTSRSQCRTRGAHRRQRRGAAAHRAS